MSTRHKTPIVRLVPHKGRVLAAVCAVLSKSMRDGHAVTQYDIVKTLFLADRDHLNRFGRPITFDNYIAMKHGPVASFAYDLLKSSDKFALEYGMAPPWVANQLPPPSTAMQFTIVADAVRQEWLEELSDSDIEALEESLVIVKRLGFAQLRKLTHEDASYENAWDDESDRKSFPMSLGLMFDSPDFERAEDIAFASENM